MGIFTDKATRIADRLGEKADKFTLADVPDLLDKSRAAHLAYRTAIHEQQTSDAKQAIRKAGKFRALADLVDPDHASPAWSDEPVSFEHGNLLTFYLDMVAR